MISQVYVSLAFEIWIWLSFVLNPLKWFSERANYLLNFLASAIHYAFQCFFLWLEFTSPAPITAPGPMRHAVTFPHRLVSPYVRLPTPQGIVTAGTAMGSGQVITLKQLTTPRQRPSILRRVIPGGDEGVVGMTNTFTTSTVASPRSCRFGLSSVMLKVLFSCKLPYIALCLPNFKSSM